jgi:glucose-6-phosphate isomerase
MAVEQYRYLAAFPPGLKRVIDDAVLQADADALPRRIWEEDTSVWPGDADERAAIGNRLGWLNVAAAMRGRVPALKKAAAGAYADGFRHAVLLGMGGSSLAPEVLSETFGTKRGSLSLEVLDNTAPDAVAALAARIDMARTLFLVSSKSGTTTETLSFYHYFFDAAAARGKHAPGRQFIAVTDPGTSLDGLARDQGFRAVFANPPDIGGRYSALSYFALAPAALMGLDTAALLASARRMAAACAGGVPAADNPGIKLGAALGALAREGRDKLSLVLSPRLRAFGAWVEQLVAESSGKAGRGIVPVDGEPLGDPGVYGDDRVFVAIGLHGDRGGPPESTLAALARAGHPVIRWTLNDPLELGAEFLRWELATAAACAVLGVNPFDEPNVTEAKDTTREILGTLRARGAMPEDPPLASEPGLALHGPLALRGGVVDMTAGLRAMLMTLDPGDYLALLAYLPRDARTDAALERIRVGIRDRVQVATTAGYGPRYLHSTGQLHKGGANNGVFLIVTHDSASDLPVPGESYSFGELNRAQALGDQQVLERHGRRVLRVHLSSDTAAGLRRLEQLLSAALA